MKYRILPGTHLKVSEIGFAAGPFTPDRSGRRSEEEEAAHLIRYSLDRGINFFDVAAVDDQERLETLLGDALAEDRERAVIAARFDGRDISPKGLHNSCEESLKRFRTDHIDLYQIQHPKMTAVEREDLYVTLGKLKKEGKILVWGAALGPGLGGCEEASLLMRFRKARVLQIPFGLLVREAGRDLLSEGRKFGAGFLIRADRFSGFLGGNGAEKLHFLVRKNRTLGQSLLKWVLAGPQAVSVLAEIEGEDQINEWAAASECPDVTAEEMERISALHKHQAPLTPPLSPVGRRKSEG